MSEAARSEAENGVDDALDVPLGPDKDLVGVLPSGQWRASAMSAMNTGNFQAWAELCLTEEGYDTWLDIDPTLNEITEFFGEYQKIEGMSPLGSRASRRSARRTKKR